MIKRVFLFFLLVSSINGFALDSSIKVTFFNAVENNNYYAVGLMLKMGISVETRDERVRYRPTALMIAAQHGGLETIKLLVKNGADVNAVDTSGFIALMTAVYFSQTKVVSFLVEKGSFINKINEDGFNVLHLALHLGRRNGPVIFEFLVSKGANINLRDNFRRTPLYNVAYRGYLKLAKLLIFKGAKVDIIDVDGTTPLMVAATGGDFLLTKYFLEHGADKNIVNNSGETALDMAIKNNSRPDLNSEEKKAYRRIIKLLEQ